ncbi:MAG: exosortase K [Desulfomonilaceae bacterium]
MRKLLSGIPNQCVSTGQVVFGHVAATYSRTDLFSVGLTVLVLLLLKRHYSLATATQLDWILAPTAKLVSWSTSAHLVPEIGVGHVDLAKGIVVAPACAGVNFMIMAFGLTAFYGLRHVRRFASQLAWLLLALAAAYGLTLVVNTMRIALSMSLYDVDIYTGWLTVARVHRLAGVGLYFSALWLHFLGLRQVMAIYCRHFVRQKHHKHMHTSGWWVWSWYLLVALAIPLANLAWQNASPAFGEHCITVFIACPAFWALIMVISRLFKILYRCLSGWFPDLYVSKPEVM